MENRKYRLGEDRSVKTFIVYISYHHWNTEKITKPIGEVLEAELRSPRAHLKAFDVYSSLRLIGGKDKERPNEGDIQDAKRFAVSKSK